MSLSELLLEWYDREKRSLPWRGTHDPYRIWLSEIMLQQTRAESVIRYYERFLAAFPNVQALANAELDTVLKLWEGLGYYARARNLHRCAAEVVQRFGARFPDTAKGLLALPGIGRYTANAIASIAYGEVVPALDGNQARVYSRVPEWNEPIKTPFDLEAVAMAHIDRVRPGDYNQALMDLGSRICTPRSPKCTECPLKSICLAAQNGSQEGYPIIIKSATKRDIRLTVVLAEHPDGYVLHQRPKNGLLGGLYEFILLEGTLAPEEILTALYEAGFGQGEFIEALPDARHVFTHLIWHMSGARVRVKRLPEGYFAARDLSPYAFPSALRAYRSLV